MTAGSAAADLTTLIVRNTVVVTVVVTGAAAATAVGPFETLPITTPTANHQDSDRDERPTLSRLDWRLLTYTMVGAFLRVTSQMIPRMISAATHRKMISIAPTPPPIAFAASQFC